MSRIGNIKKLSDTRFLNFYEFEAVHRDGTSAPYFVASRAKKIEQLKAVSHKNKPDGVVLFGVYGEKKDRVVLVRQYRYAAAQAMLEVPAGKIEHDGESPDYCAARELEEEAGVTASEILPLGYTYTSPGFCSERIYLYLARGLQKGKQHLDDDEFMNVEYYTPKEMEDLIDKNEITDAKTIAAFEKARKYLPGL